jgi:hypothetical protein
LGNLLERGQWKDQVKATYLWLYNPCGPWPVFQLRSVRLKASAFTQKNTNRIYAHTDIHALNGIKLTIPVFEQAKMVHDLDRATTAFGM